MTRLATARLQMAGLERRVHKTRTPPTPTRGQSTLLAIQADPAAVLTRAGVTPDPWQASVLRAHPSRILLLCGRQCGKSLTAAALALHRALTRPGSLILLLSPTLRQSGELFRDKVLRLANGLGWPLPPRRLTATELELANASRIVSLPESESGIRGFSGVSLLVIDEAARVEDGLYKAVRPMVSTSAGAIAGLSTPCGKRGWFWERWEGQQARGGEADHWHRVKVTAEQCPRISPAFLSEERLELGERWYEQEYLCIFNELVGAVFSEEDVARAFATSDVLPLFGGAP